MNERCEWEVSMKMSWGYTLNGVYLARGRLAHVLLVDGAHVLIALLGSHL